MIIKKKYIKAKKIIPEIPKEEILAEENIISQAPKPVESIVETSQEPIIEEKTIEPEIDDLDLAIENIKFDQREERREGTRRRGYRRTQERNLITRAQQEAISIKEAAKKEGYEEGIQNASAALNELRSKFSEFYSYKDEVFEKVSECIFDVAIEIAKKIIKQETETKKETIIPIIKEAVSEINKTENKIILHVMPKDAEIVKEKLPEIFSENNTEAKILVIADNEIKEGGVIIETSNGIIDAAIETQLSIIEKALRIGKGS